MKVVVLQPDYDQSKHCAIKDYDFRRDLTPWLPGHEVEYVYLRKATSEAQLRALHADVFVNLCDGSWDDDAPGIDVVLALEDQGKAFTGASHDFYDPSKEMMKQIAFYWGIPTAPYVIARNEAGVAEAEARLRFPMFVKHYHGGNSVGITRANKVTNGAELRAQAARIMHDFGGALIEEFVDGREFSVLVSSNAADERAPHTYRPVECVFGEDENFKTFDFKWRSGVRNPWKPVTDEALARRLQEMTVLAYLGLGGSGYARSDIRMDREGNLFFLELNPNCSIFYPDDNGGTADLVLMYDGIGKTRFMERIIEYALARQRRSVPCYVTRLDPVLGNGMIAARDIKAGEMIYQLEERPHTLVSKARVEAMWNARDRQFFIDFCYPITDDLYCMWDLNPKNWKPINHCCDPNAWVTGLDLFARRDIKKGEPITMDYATMYTYNHMTFKCQCGAAACRGMWRGTDYQQPWFEERYGDHVTDYVKQKKKLLKEYGRVSVPEPLAPLPAPAAPAPEQHAPAAAPAAAAAAVSTSGASAVHVEAGCCAAGHGAACAAGAAAAPAVTPEAAAGGAAAAAAGVAEEQRKGTVLVQA